MDDFSLKCFGVGDGTASLDRNHSAYLYRLGTATLLVDCGEPVSRSFKATGLSYETIDRIFLSHLHSDHVGGLFMLLQGFWLEQRRQQLTIHLPGDAIQPIANMLKAAYLFAEVLPFPLRFEALAAAQPISFAHVQVTPYRTTHLDSLKKHFQSRYPGEYAAYCFQIVAGQRRIAHSADIGTPEDLDPLLEQPVDLLVCELAHFEPEELFAYLKNKKIGQILFTHLSRWNWERLPEMEEMAAEMLPKANVTFARDQHTAPL